MARALNNGRISLSPTEKECAHTAFSLIGALINEEMINADLILEATAQNLDLAGDVEYPAEHEHGSNESNETFKDIEEARADYRREIAIAAFVDAAAEFGVRIQIDDYESKGW